MKSATSWLDGISFQKASILVAILLLLIGAALVYWSRFPVEPLIEREAVRDAVQTARPRIMNIISAEDLQGPMAGARYTEVDKIIREYVVGTYVDRIKLWSPKGQTVYSTLATQIGETFPDNEEFLEAMEGETVWEVTNEPESQDERQLGTSIEVYIPLVWQEGGDPAGVLEVYFDYSHHLALLAAIQKSTVGILLVMTGAFVVGFLLLFRSGSRGIRRQRDLADAHAKRLQVIKDVTSVMTSQSELEDKVSRTLEVLVVAAEASGAVLRVVDEDAKVLSVVSRVGLAPQNPVAAAVVARGAGLAGAAWKQGKTVVANDYSTHQDALPEIQAAGVKSMAALPIAHAGRTIGVVAVNANSIDHFNAERIELLEAAANEFGNLLENARLQAQIDSELARSRRRLDAFKGAARRIVLEEDPLEALNNALEGARSLTGARWGGLFLKDGDNHLATWIAQGMSTEVEGRIRAALERTVIQTEDAEPYRDITIEGILASAGLVALDSGQPPATEVLHLPLTSRAGATGGLFVAGKLEGRGFSEDDARVLSLYAVGVQILLANLDLYAAVVREQRRLANIQESMSEGLLVVNSSMLLEYVNPSAETLLAMEANDMISHRLDDCLATISGQTERLKAIGAARFAMERPEMRPEPTELIVDRPCRKEIELTSFHVPGDQSGPMAGLLLRNITVERDLQRKRDAFVAMASHQLRTPLVSVMGFTELLLKREPPPEVRRQWLEQILQESQRLTAIADDILNGSRIQQGNLPVDLAPVSIQLQVAGVLANLKSTTEKHRFIVQIDDSTPNVIADQRKVVDVLTNLLDNAMKYSPRGGTITIRARGDQEGSRVVVSVEDEGIGIAPEHMDKLFAAFTRIETPETVGRGTGLGLYIVKGLLKLMSGEIWVESTPGKGSVFSFSLPAHKLP